MDTLSRLAKNRPSKPAPGERCEFCAVPIEEAHSHLVDTRNRRLMCSCRPCYIVFTPKGAAQDRYKPVPERYERVDFTLSGEAWDELQIPISIAFFFRNSESGGMVAFYPGPAGATESLLPLGAWDAATRDSAALATLQPDVEATLVRRPKDGPQTCYIVPIDVCYELVGLIRTCWRGFDGGTEAWEKIDGFFVSIERKCAGAVDARRS